MHPVPVYSLSPRQIVNAMFTKHGQTTGPDLHKLRDPLLKLLPALAELETHMNLFMLASLKLTASGHGENPYKYFEMLLDSRLCQGIPRAPAAADRLLYRVPYGKPADNYSTFRVSPPSHHAHDGRIQRVSVFRGSNCAAQAYPEPSPEAAQKRKRSQTAVGTVDRLRPAGISTSFCRSCPASPNTACFHWPESRGGVCGRTTAMLCGDGDPHLQSTFLLLLTIPGTKMALRPAASLTLVLADFTVDFTAGATAMADSPQAMSCYGQRCLLSGFSALRHHPRRHRGQP
jgi:hypothetical protein